MPLKVKKRTSAPPCRCPLFLPFVLFFYPLDCISHISFTSGEKCSDRISKLPSVTISQSAAFSRLSDYSRSLPDIHPFRANHRRSGRRTSSQLVQKKNTFIVAVTLVSRAAIRGGMDVEDAFSHSDSYIQQCELLSSPSDILNLQYRMVLDYTERVERFRLGKQPSKLTIDVANYIQHHMSEPISTEKMAEELFLNRSYLSRKFKEETGETLTDFILKEKTEEAKRLLRYSDKSLTAIGSYLGFSSASHFSRVFKTLDKSPLSKLFFIRSGSALLRTGPLLWKHSLSNHNLRRIPASAAGPHCAYRYACFP